MDGCDHRVPALVFGGSFRTRTGERLVVGVAGEYTVSDGRSGVEGDAGEAGGDRVADVVEVGCPTADDTTESDNGINLGGERLDDDGDFQGPDDDVWAGCGSCFGGRSQWLLPGVCR